MGKRYDYRHQQERAKWKPAVDAGLVTCHEPICLMPSRRIAPGTPWHLSHTPDGKQWTGPSHVRCNTSEAAIRGNNMRRGIKRNRRAWVL